MSVNYSYKILSVDEAARCMEVLYTSEGRQPMHIGARLPFVGESLETVIEQFAPVPYWLALEAPVALPTIGATGTISSGTAAAVIEPGTQTFSVDEVIV
jgi:hypothetical protein